MSANAHQVTLPIGTEAVTTDTDTKGNSTCLTLEACPACLAALADERQLRAHLLAYDPEHFGLASKGEGRNQSTADIFGDQRRPFGCSSEPLPWNREDSAELPDADSYDAEIAKTDRQMALLAAIRDADRPTRKQLRNALDADAKVESSLETLRAKGYIKMDGLVDDGPRRPERLFGLTAKGHAVLAGGDAE